jgi:hypothetical protein
MNEFGNGYIEKVWCNSVTTPQPLKVIPYLKDYKVFFSVRGTEIGRITIGVFVDDILDQMLTTNILEKNKSLAIWFWYPYKHKQKGKHVIQFKIGEATDRTADSVTWKYTSDKYIVEVI